MTPLRLGLALVSLQINCAIQNQFIMVNYDTIAAINLAAVHRFVMSLGLW